MHCDKYELLNILTMILRIILEHNAINLQEILNRIMQGISYEHYSLSSIPQFTTDSLTIIISPDEV